MRSAWNPRRVGGGLILLLMTLLAFGCSGDDSPVLPTPGIEAWVLVNPLPPSNELNGICGDGAGGLFVVGSAGTAIHFGSGDRLGSDLYDGIRLWDVFANGPSDAYAYSVWPGNVYHYDGESWALHTEFTEIRGLWSAGPDKVFVASRYSVFEFGGTFWTEHRLPQPPCPGPYVCFYSTVDDVWGAGADDVYALIGGYVAHYDGMTWELGDHIGKNRIWGSAPDDIFAIGGTDGRIAHFDGSAWTFQDSGTSVSFNHIWGSGPADVYVLGDDNTILRFDGESWSPMPIDIDLELRDIGGTGPGAVYVVGEYGTMYYHDGLSWVPYSQDSRQPFYSLWGCSEQDMWLAGAAGLSRFDGVNLYDSEEIPVTDLWGTGCDEVFGVGGGIFRFDGTAWEPESIPVAVTYNGVWGRSGNEVYAVGNAGTILRYDGQSWREESSPVGTTLVGVWGSPEAEGDVFVVGLSGTILRNAGSGWLAQESGTESDLVCVWGTTGTNVYAVGNGVILHYDGTIWTPVRGPEELGLSAYNSIWGQGADDIYFGGQAEFPRDSARIRGLVVHYDGANWSLQRAGVEPRITHIWGNGSGAVYALGFGGTVLSLTNVNQ